MTDKRHIKLVHKTTVDADHVREWIDANATPGDTVAVTNPDTGDKTFQIIYEE